MLYDSLAGTRNMNVRVAYENTNFCMPPCELSIEIDGIGKRYTVKLQLTSSLTKYTDPLVVDFASNAVDQNLLTHELKLRWQGLGIGPSIFYLEIFTGNNERLYSASGINERLVMSAGEIDIDNIFSPKHFYRYIKATNVCAEYYGEWWYTLI